MNGFHDTPGLLRQLEAASNAMESIRRTQQALDYSAVLERVRRAEKALNFQLSATIRGAQQTFDYSAVLKIVRRAEMALNSQLSATIRGAQQAFDYSALLDFCGVHTGNGLTTRVTEVTRERARARDLFGQRLRKVGQTATNRLVRLTSRRKIRRPVGSSLRRVAEFVFSKKSYEQIYDPLINDLRFEHCEALAANRRGKAGWVRVRGYGSFLTAALAHFAGSGGHLVVRVWRLFQPGG